MKAGEHIGPYRIVKRLGEGGIGEVFQAFDESLARDVAIKRLRPELAERNTLVARFRTEAQTLARLNHPNIATLHALVDEGNATYMVMEYVAGDTVAALLRSRGALDLEPALRLAFQALAGIGYAHDRGVIHRDIKGSNLMLDANGTLKIMDFGIARVLGDERHTRAGQLIGTPEFMAPEQIRGEDADERSDLYSLAILLFSLFTGHPPFQARSEYDLMKAQVEEKAPSLLARCPDLPDELDAVFRKALAKEAGHRFQNAAELRAALQPFASDSWSDGPLIWPRRKSNEAECALIDDVDIDAPTAIADRVGLADSLPLIDAVLIDGASDAGSRACVAAPNETPTTGFDLSPTIDEPRTSPGAATESPHPPPRWATGPRLVALGFAIGAVMGLDLVSTAPQPPSVSADGTQSRLANVQIEASSPPNSSLGASAPARELRENLFTTNQSTISEAMGHAAPEGREKPDAEDSLAPKSADRAKAPARVGRSTMSKRKPRASTSARERGEQGWVIRR